MPTIMIPSGGSIPSPPSPRFTQSVCRTRSGQRKIIKYYKDGNRVTATGLPVTENCITSSDCQCCSQPSSYISPSNNIVNREVDVTYHSQNTYRQPLIPNQMGGRMRAMMLIRRPIKCPTVCRKNIKPIDSINITSPVFTINYSVTANGGLYQFNDGNNTITNNLELNIGNTYIFDLSSVGIFEISDQGHPFYISTSSNNTTTNIHSSNDINIDGNILTFIPTVPQILFYNCVKHSGMTGNINIS